VAGLAVAVARLVVAGAVVAVGRAGDGEAGTSVGAGVSVGATVDESDCVGAAAGWGVAVDRSNSRRVGTLEQPAMTSATKKKAANQNVARFINSAPI
jgi:hypothetical protein